MLFFFLVQRNDLPKPCNSEVLDHRSNGLAFKNIARSLIASQIATSEDDLMLFLISSGLAEGSREKRSDVILGCLAGLTSPRCHKGFLYGEVTSF